MGTVRGEGRGDATNSGSATTTGLNGFFKTAAVLKTAAAALLKLLVGEGANAFDAAGLQLLLLVVAMRSDSACTTGDCAREDALAPGTCVLIAGNGM